MDFDDILADVGEFGRYQFFLLVFFILPPCLPGAFHGFVQIFAVATPEDYWCHMPRASRYNLTVHQIQNLLPQEFRDGHLAHSRCSVYEKEHSNGTWWQSNHTIPCNFGWDYDRSTYESTIVTDWDLVCGKDFLPTASLFIHTIGTLVGTVISGYLTDEIGRKKTFYLAAMIQLATWIATVLSPNFIVFCIIRFLNGLSVVPVWLIPLVMSLEFVGPSKRAPVGTTTALFFTFGVITLGGIAYFVRNWVYLQLAVTVPFLFFISYWWWMPESPRWLMSRGRFTEMMVIVRKMAYWNRAGLSEGYFAGLLVKCEASFAMERGKRHYRILDLFRTPNLRKKSCLIIFNSFCNYAVYSGLNFLVPHLGGKDHINFLYGALIELPAYPAMYLTLNRLGRRFLLMSSMMIGGSFLIATALVPETEHLIVILLFLTSKFFMTFAFFITDLMASELFPTVLRGAGASLTQTVSTVGLCLSPLIAHLGSYGLWMPLVIFGVLGIVGGMATILLPETLNQNLPETLEEAEEFGKGMTWRDYLHFCGSSSSGNAPCDSADTNERDGGKTEASEMQRLRDHD